eukprot:360661-Alexandrium_andersonii.AAC.1
MLRPGTWVPKTRHEPPPLDLHLGDNRGQFGLVMWWCWESAWNDSGQTYDGMFAFAAESGEDKAREQRVERDAMRDR